MSTLKEFWPELTLVAAWVVLLVFTGFAASWTTAGVLLLTIVFIMVVGFATFTIVGSDIRDRNE